MIPPKEIEIYKVCRELPDGRLVSAMAGMKNVMEYAIGRETKPIISCGPLAGFLFLNQAAAFAKSFNYLSDTYRVFLARATLSHKRALYIGWGLVDFGGWSTDLANCSEGTILCDSITLLKEVL